MLGRPPVRKPSNHRTFVGTPQILPYGESASTLAELVEPKYTCHPRTMRHLVGDNLNDADSEVTTRRISLPWPSGAPSPVPPPPRLWRPTPRLVSGATPLLRPSLPPPHTSRSWNFQRQNHSANRSLLKCGKNVPWAWSRLGIRVILTVAVGLGDTVWTPPGWRLANPFPLAAPSQASS